MRLPRHPLLPVLVGLTALAACGSAPARSSTVVRTAPVTTTAAGTAGATTTAGTPSAPGSTTAPTTTASGAAPTTAATATTATTGAPVGTTAPGATAPAATAPRTTVAGLPARVTAAYGTIGYPVTDVEAACLATATPEATVAAIEKGGDGALVGAVAGSLVQALARCEPQSFLEEQDQITVEDYGVDPKQARCVTKALDAAAVADPVVAQAYFEGTTTLAADKQQRLIDALTPCVGAPKAREIITT